MAERVRGMGVTHNDVSVVTNVSADHLGMQGIDTVDQLAEVKAKHSATAFEHGQCGATAARLQADQHAVVEGAALVEDGEVGADERGDQEGARRRAVGRWSGRRAPPRLE